MKEITFLILTLCALLLSLRGNYRHYKENKRKYRYVLLFHIILLVLNIAWIIKILLLN